LRAIYTGNLCEYFNWAQNANPGENPGHIFNQSAIPHPVHGIKHSCIKLLLTSQIPRIFQGAYPESPSYHKKIPVGAAFSREIK
jgi:hypothetical protein